LNLEYEAWNGLKREEEEAYDTLSSANAALGTKIGEIEAERSR